MQPGPCRLAFSPTTPEATLESKRDRGSYHTAPRAKDATFGDASFISSDQEKCIFAFYFLFFLICIFLPLPVLIIPFRATGINQVEFLIEGMRGSENSLECVCRT